MKIATKSQASPKAYSSDSNQIIFDFLQAQPIGILATVDANNEPCATVIYYSIDDSFTAMFTTKRGTKKHDVLQRNNHVQLLVYEASSQTAAQISGVAEEIKNETDANRAFDGTLKAASETSKGGVPPVSKLQAGYYVAYRIKPAHITMTVYSNPDTGGFKQYEAIDF